MKRQSAASNFNFCSESASVHSAPAVDRSDDLLVDTDSKRNSPVYVTRRESTASTAHSYPAARKWSLSSAPPQQRASGIDIHGDKDPAIHFEFGQPDEFHLGDSIATVPRPSRPPSRSLRLLGWFGKPVAGAKEEDGQSQSSSSAGTIADKETAASMVSIPSHATSSLLHDAEVRWNRTKTILCAVICALSIVASVSLAGTIYLAVTRNEVDTDEFYPRLPRSTDSIPRRDIRWEKLDSQDPELFAILAKPNTERFWGINFPSYNECPTQREVYKTISELSRVTRHVRLASTDCYVSDFILQAVHDLDLDLKIALGIRMHNESQALSDLNDLRGVISERPAGAVEAVYIGEDSVGNSEVSASVAKSFKSYVNDFLIRQGLFGVNVGPAERTGFIVEAAATTTNPLTEWPTLDPELLANVLNRDKLRVHAKIEPQSSSDVSKWLCEVVPHLDSGVQWYWSGNINVTSCT